MADGSWSQSGCQPSRPDVWWFGFPGQGCYYWTFRFGQHWVGSNLALYAAWNHECGQLGPPVKDFEFLTEFGAAGQWFEHGAMYFKFGTWHVVIADYGQTAGRLADVGEWPTDAELPPGSDDEAPPPPPAPKVPSTS